jgi:hypothetical protein
MVFKPNLKMFEITQNNIGIYISYFLIVIALFVYSKRHLQDEKQLIDESNKILRNYIDNECKKILDIQNTAINELKKEIKFLRDNLSKKTQQISNLERHTKILYCNDKRQNNIGTQTETQIENCNIIPKDLTDGIFMRLRSSDKNFS